MAISYTPKSYAYSDRAVFEYVQRTLSKMMEEAPDGMTIDQVLDAALEQLAARNAFDKSAKATIFKMRLICKALENGTILHM